MGFESLRPSHFCKSNTLNHFTPIPDLISIISRGDRFAVVRIVCETLSVGAPDSRHEDVRFSTNALQILGLRMSERDRSVSCE